MGRPPPGRKEEEEEEDETQTSKILLLFSDKFQQSKKFEFMVPQTQFIDDVWTLSMCNRDRYVVFWYRKLWLFRSCSSSLAVNIPFVPQTPIPMVQSAQQIMEIPQLLLILVVDVPVAGSCRFSGAAVEKPLALPQLQLVEKSVSFSDPLYLTVTCSVFVFAFGEQDFLGDDSRNGFRTQHSSV